MVPRATIRGLVALQLIATALPTNARGQIFLELRGGAMLSSALVRDSIVEAFTVRPAVAPTIDLAVGTVLNEQYRLAVAVRWARSDLKRSTDGGNIPIIPLTAWTGSVALRRRLSSWASAQGTIGAVKYAPAGTGRNATLFRDNAPLLPIVGLGARIEHRISPRLVVGLDAAYDFHRFSTLALRAEGITGDRSVHRFSLGITLGASYADKKP
ncbi:MAG: hypothetical protein GTN62_11350 [Gemmatimonadales bacterium]|nr:hypothetical protein [Gemmatimonadales bacterium]NIN50690.1 hypothetical protein [Gemmatimonadales bacterium]NIP08154.1 hypothetical protein [Gemmatimonadales bacterium]NIR01032.1 hypothetical protein [Gemmatimonadales bacterium]NIS65111.1 hypothetical protein [Gemmatimonadales bacterium]